MRNTTILTLLLLLSSCTPAPEFAKEEPVLEWKAENLVEASSTVIVVGRLQVEADEIRAAADDSGDHVNVKIQVSETLKGEHRDHRAFTFYSRYADPKSYSNLPTAKEMIRFLDQEVIVFLLGYGGDCYLAETSWPGTVVLSDADAVARVRALVNRHDLLAARPLPGSPFADEVARRFDQAIESVEAQRESFAAIEKLGPDAIPALIPYLDDVRKLPENYITLENHAVDAFEAVRHMKAVKVSDATMEILGQWTGIHFGLGRGDSAAALRAHVSRAWRIYHQITQG